MPKFFKANPGRSLMTGLFGLGLMTGLIAGLAVLILKKTSYFIPVFLTGMLAGTVIYLISRCFRVAVVEEESVWFGTGRHKKQEFLFKDSNFQTVKDTRVFICLPVTTRTLIVDTVRPDRTGEIRKQIDLSYLSRDGWENFCAALRTSREAYIVKKNNPGMPFAEENRYLSDPGMEIRTYDIPKDNIKRSIRRKIWTNITVYIVVALVFLALMIVPVLLNGTGDTKTYITLTALWAVTVVILFAAVFPLLHRWKKDESNIPENVIVTESAVFFDGVSYSFHEIERLSMSGKGGRDGRRKIVIKRNGEKTTYSFGIVDKHFELFPEYVDLYRNLEKNLGMKFVCESI